MIVRSLLTVLGYKGDSRELHNYSAALNKVIGFLKIAAVAVTAVAGVMVKWAGDMEQTEMAFETMLGSQEKSNALIKELQTFAAKTPFEYVELVNYTKQLIAANFATEKIIPTMRMLGDIASGVGRDKLPNLVEALNKIKIGGRATARELQSIQLSGVPVYDALKKILNVGSIEEVRKQISQGKVTYEQVEAALKHLADTKYTNLMVKQSDTFLGILSNIQDIIGQIGTEIGKKVLPPLKSMAKYFLDFLETSRSIVVSGLSTFFYHLMDVMAYTTVIVKRLFDRLGGFEKIGSWIDTFLSSFSELGTSVLNSASNVAMGIGTIVDSIAELEKQTGLIRILLGALGQLIELLSSVFNSVAFLFGFVVDSITDTHKQLTSDLEDIGSILSGKMSIDQYMAKWKEQNKKKENAPMNRNLQNAINSVLGLPLAAAEEASYFNPLPEEVITPHLKGSGSYIQKKEVEKEKTVLPFRGNINNTTVGDVNVNITVPPGTTEEQARYLAEYGKKGTTEALDNVLKNAKINNPTGKSGHKKGGGSYSQ